MIDLSKLAEFNPAIIYAFEAEAPHNANHDSSIESVVYPTVSQHKDLLDGYLYAQNEILPFFTVSGKTLATTLESVTEQQFLGWVDKLHGYLGKSLLALYQEEAGKYTKRSVMRWHDGCELVDHLTFYLAKQHPQCKTEAALIDLLVSEYKTGRVAITQFIKVLHKIAGDKRISIHPSQIPYLPRGHVAYEGMVTMNKLQSAYWSPECLTPDEKKIIEKIVKICMFPTEVPEAMHRYAVRTLQQLKNCNPKNCDEVSAFLAESFYALTDIHPYANANGRVATCFMNVLLRVFGFPSIILRKPGEKTENDSEYSLAIAQIDSSREPLKALIKKRVLEAMKQPFADAISKELLEVRDRFVEVTKQLKQIAPRFELENLKMLAGQSLGDAAYQNADWRKNTIAFLKCTTEIALRLIASKQQQAAPTAAVGLFATSKDATRKTVKENLTKLSDYADWKINCKTGIIAWMETESETVAKAIYNKLEIANFAKCTMGKHEEKAAIFCVKCEENNSLYVYQ